MKYRREHCSKCERMRPHMICEDVLVCSTCGASVHVEHWSLVRAILKGSGLLSSHEEDMDSEVSTHA